MRYRVKIVEANKSTLIEECLITTIPNNYEVAKEAFDIKFDQLFYKDGFSLCSETQFPFGNFSAIIINQTNDCGLVAQIKRAQSKNIKIVVIVTSISQIVLPFLKEEFKNFPIIILLPLSRFNEISNRVNNSMIGIYGSMGSNLVGDILTAVILISIIILSVGLIIILTVAFHKEHFTKLDQPNPNDTRHMKWAVAIFPIMMIVTLLLLYFLYNVFVWVIIIFFYFAAAFSVMSFAMLFVLKFQILPNLIYPFNKLGFQNFDLRAIGFFLIGLVVATTWIITRKNMVGLVLNNIIGILLCAEIAIGLGLIFVISKLFRFLLLFLSITVLIDACMVYIPAPGGKSLSLYAQLPAFVYNDSLSRVKRDAGDSIMEKVVTGMAGNSSEEVPVRFKIPRVDMNYNLSTAACQSYVKSFSMVGFGDVILPGAFIVFVLTFSVATKSSVTLYSLFILLWYIIGIAITFLVVTMTGKGQPALVYLVPCTVLPTIILSFFKNDFFTLWNHNWSLDVAERLKDFDEVIQESSLEKDESAS